MSCCCYNKYAKHAEQVQPSSSTGAEDKASSTILNAQKKGIEEERKQRVAERGRQRYKVMPGAPNRRMTEKQACAAPRENRRHGERKQQETERPKPR